MHDDTELEPAPAESGVVVRKRRLTAELPIEVVGEKLRAMMPWIKKNRLVDQSRN